MYACTHTHAPEHTHMYILYMAIRTRRGSILVVTNPAARPEDSPPHHVHCVDIYMHMHTCMCPHIRLYAHAQTPQHYYHGTCSLTVEYVLFLYVYTHAQTPQQYYHRMCSLTIECVLFLYVCIHTHELL